MRAIINTAIRAARKAGEVIIRSLDTIDTLDPISKGRNDFVTEVDQRAEHEIISIIRKMYPNHAVVAEESGRDGKHDFTWIIDPLDGTSNFIHGIPHFAVSIAIDYKGRLEGGVIYDPIRQELFTGIRGEGAKLNDRRIRVSNRLKLSDALICTGFPNRQNQPVEIFLDTFNRVLPAARGFRRTGSAALDLAYVAAGRFDGFWEIGIHSWDMAAGALMIREAGGLVGDLQGGEDFLQSGNIIAGNPKIFKALLQTIHPAIPATMK